MSNKKHHWIIHYLPVYGCISTGIIYASIGVVAILSFLKLKDGGADEYRLMAFLGRFLWGKIIIFIILAGTLCYIGWRFYEAVTDPYRYGNDAGGIAKRAGISLSTLADILIVYAAFRFLLGIGNIQESEQLSQHRQMIDGILQKGSGNEIVITAGIVYLVTAVIQFVYGITKGYRERMEIEELKPGMRKPVHLSAFYGYMSKGIILGITGFFYVKAGCLKNSRWIVDTDKAFDFIGDNIGHIPFIIVAAGTISYGLFMITLGIVYDIDKD